MAKEEAEGGGDRALGQRAQILTVRRQDRPSPPE